MCVCVCLDTCFYVWIHFVRVCRLEREWEEKMLKEREQMLCELEGAQQTAQAELDRQQQEFQHKIHTLSIEMVSV